MTKFIDLKEEVKIVKENVEFFRMVRKHIKEAYGAADEFYLSINENAIINALCYQYDVNRGEYDETAKYFNEYILGLIKR